MPVRCCQGGICVAQAYCGDGTCNNGETQTSCCQDCGCPSTSDKCLSGQCCTIPAIGGVCGPTCGCATGSVCYASVTTHTMACGASGNFGVGTACAYANDCASGLGCFRGSCTTYCQTDSDCPAVDGVRKCEQVTWEDGTNVSGVKDCARICDPVNPQDPRSPLLSCPAGFGCASSSTGASYCYVSGSLTNGSPCTYSNDCLPGYYCSPAGYVCRRYCSTQADCPSGTTCRVFSPPQYAATFNIDACVP